MRLELASGNSKRTFISSVASLGIIPTPVEPWSNLRVVAHLIVISLAFRKGLNITKKQ